MRFLTFSLSSIGRHGRTAPPLILAREARPGEKCTMARPVSGLYEGLRRVLRCNQRGRDRGGRRGAIGGRD